MIINPYRFASGGAFDPDAQAFFTASGLTGATELNAVNQLVLDLKGYGIWTKMKAIYPMVGGTAALHKWNLKDPQDLVAAFRLVFNGGWTHTSTGALPNGTNGWADTFLGTNVMSLDSIHLSYYSRTNNTSGTVEMGVLKSGPNSYTDLGVGYLTNGAFTRLNNGGGVGFVANAGSNGFFQGNRIISSTTKLYKNGISIQTLTAASSATTTFPISIGAVNNIGTGAKTFYSNKECAFSSIGDGLTDTEAANFYTAVQAYQVALGRSIGTQTVSDADAQAFVNAAVIEDQVQANAVNTLVIDMKAANIWTKMKAIYPFVGGTAASHKWNLKNPLDTNAAFRLTFNGGWTHDANGITGNGTNNFANTFLVPNTDLLLDSTHISAYTRSNITVNAPLLSSENTSTYNNGLYIWARQVGLLTNSVRINDNTSSSASSPADIRGLHIATRTASNVKNYRFNQTQQFSLNVPRSAKNTSSIYLGASRNNANYNSSNLAFSTVGEGLSNLECDNLYLAVQAFNTTLNRQV